MNWTLRRQILVSKNAVRKGLAIRFETTSDVHSGGDRKDSYGEAVE